MKFNKLFLVALLIGIFCVAFCFEEEKTTTPLAKAPEISLLSPKGKTIKLSDLKGKLVLIDFGHLGVALVERKVRMWWKRMQNIIRESLQTARDLKFLAFP